MLRLSGFLRKFTVFTSTLLLAGLLPATSWSETPTDSMKAAQSSEYRVDPETFDARLHSQTSSEPCGRACDGKDAESYWVTPPGGIGNWYKCSWDAVTIYTRNVDGNYVELRYSPRCRTSWARGCCYQYIANRSYYSNGTFRAITIAGSWSSGSRYYTAMLDDMNLKNEACLDGQVGGPSEWRFCTDRW